MTKQGFREELEKRLQTLPMGEREKTISYYEEMIDDRMEDGMLEEEAVEAIGSMEEVVENIMYDLSVPMLLKRKMNESKNKTSNILVWTMLLILGSPLWASMLLAIGSVALSVYFSIWALIVSMYAVVGSLGVAGVVGVVVGVVQIFNSSLGYGLCCIGIALVCGSGAILLFSPMQMVTKKLIQFTSWLVRKCKTPFVRNEKK